MSIRLGGRGHKAPREDAWIMSTPNKLDQICNYVILSLIENLVRRNYYADRADTASKFKQTRINIKYRFNVVLSQISKNHFLTGM